MLLQNREQWKFKDDPFSSTGRYLVMWIQLVEGLNYSILLFGKIICMHQLSWTCPLTNYPGKSGSTHVVQCIILTYTDRLTYVSCLYNQSTAVEIWSPGSLDWYMSHVGHWNAKRWLIVTHNVIGESHKMETNTMNTFKRKQTLDWGSVTYRCER